MPTHIELIVGGDDAAVEGCCRAGSEKERAARCAWRGLGAAVIFICFLLLAQTSMPAARSAGSTAARAGGPCWPAPLACGSSTQCAFSWRAWRRPAAKARSSPQRLGDRARAQRRPPRCSRGHLLRPAHDGSSPCRCASRFAFQPAKLGDKPRMIQQLDALRVQRREQVEVQVALRLLAGFVADAVGRESLPRGHSPP